MRTVSISELKASLSKYLRIVRRGGEVQILDRGVPIARIVAIAPLAASPADEARLERLARAGVLRRGSGDARRILARPPIAVPGASLSQALQDEREENW
jgi:prevent-host-death family protein